MQELAVALREYPCVELQLVHIDALFGQVMHPAPQDVQLLAVLL
jgi:hypothetical protein